MREEIAVEISFSQTISSTCPQCRTTFEAEIWLIVDTSARPDLLDRIRRGTLHDLACPNCKQTPGQVDAPLLLYRPGEIPPLLYSPAQQITAQEDLEDAHDLVNTLRINLGDAWQETWLEHGLMGIPRPHLAAVLNDLSKTTKGATIPDLPSEFQDGLQRAFEAQRHYQLTSDRAALEETIAALEGILNHPAFPQTSELFRLSILNDAGSFFLRRYWAIGDLNDLDQSLRLLNDAVEHTPIDSPDLPVRLSNLGNALRDRYASTGKLEDLEQALEVHRRALQHTLVNSSTLPSRLSNLGLGLHTHYERTGRLEDLEQAIATFEEAVQRAPVDSPDLPAFLTNLGLGLRARYAHKDQLEDLEQAIAAFQMAVERTASKAPALPSRLTNLGGGLYDYYEHTEKLEDLEQAIGAFQAAVEHTSTNSPELPGILSNLGGALHRRYMHSGKLVDLGQAIEIFQEAMRYTTSDAPVLPSILNNLATCLNDRYEHSGQLEDLQREIAFNEEACQKGMRFAPEIALISANNWGARATKRRSWTEAARAYTYGVQAVEQLYYVQLLRANQEIWLSKVRGLHARAAYVLSRTGQLHQAVVTLEKSRARSLSESLARDRADLERIRLEDQEAYDRYQQAAEGLRQFERSEREGNLITANNSATVTNASLIERIDQARKELEQAIARIRLLPGHEGFLAETTYHDIVQAAHPNVPLVYLATIPVGSMALLVHTESDTPEVIWVDSFTEDLLDALLVKRNSKMIIGGYLPGQLFNPEWLSKALNEALPLLGKELIGPIASRLRELDAQSVVLVPTGLLGFLPLHVARYQVDNTETSLLDEFDVAYAPSARVLAAVQREAKVRQNPVLQLVGVGNPLSSIEVGAWARGELQQVVPVMQQVTRTLPSKLQAAIQISASFSLEQLSQIQLLFPLWEQTLQHLDILCQESSETVIQAGHSFQLALGLFVQFKNMLADLDSSDDIIASLDSLAKRIPPSLTYAQAELESVLTLLPADALISFYEHQATHDVIWNALPQSTLAHFACHGNFDPEAPLNSALLLASETRLTLRDLLNAEPQHLAQLRLAILSACQTAMTDFQSIPDEAVGLLSGFLQAGVPSVVGTLWSVDDLSTALLVIRFYELYLRGDQRSDLQPFAPARALRLAQRWLRDLTNNDLLAYLKNKKTAQGLSPALLKEMLPTVRQSIRCGYGDAHPYADPYHWAAFVYYGAM